ncbi:hypothetical protein TBLA_0D05680 [Henningerozyma blattae CBS 6284]|uniref:Phosphatidic acid phosphatase type 2/haloperoxidase domain-containing protein n=1 Tax=Henningerozyma blattae (strain ATCC 34711 / CBS 6284 / DSM 70876 / NBRC 10599 / NRRL Y-10934 / UCD 77-7) TaxID=1071380 RepID=I2H3V8_HENB6|nr:hypothetical protein TBLA_0D05680 [Tetrapisispora blattae CBS 6284]CCH61060.1 hypothetical protein TBLA_0D05680 [Tetrapisispora blattae CBS 6284]
MSRSGSKEKPDILTQEKELIKSKLSATTLSTTSSVDDILTSSDSITKLSSKLHSSTSDIAEEKIEKPLDYGKMDIYQLLDPGNHGGEHFKEKMSPFRYAFREYLTRYTNTQSEMLYRWQVKYRTPTRDKFFAYTSLMGSHTFFVVFLPVPLWVGHYHLCMDMVYVLGYSLYISGYLKDYWCLPRPRAPPLERISLSEYTTKEYGAPSSHTANATAVSLWLFLTLYLTDAFSVPMKLFLVFLILAYYFTLVLGRLYCGMHGVLDLASGAIIGVITFFGRLIIKYAGPMLKIDLTDHVWYPIFSVSFGLVLLFKHVRPIDFCPCYEDSVAFIGVVCGLEFSNWLIRYKDFQTVFQLNDNHEWYFIPAKIIVGVICVLIWKYVIAKPVIYGILIHIFRFEDYHVETIKSEGTIDSINKTEEFECELHYDIPKLDVYGRFFIYAGVPSTVFLVCPIVYYYLDLV